MQVKSGNLFHWEKIMIFIDSLLLDIIRDLKGFLLFLFFGDY